MNKLFKNYLLLLLCVAVTPVYSQTIGKIVFEKIEHDFGKIKEENGPAEVTFEFTNTGTAPIKLTDVKASCGCTTPKWTQEEIAPGKTGIITASYDPSNRPGVFTKTITVTTDGQPEVSYLTIKGDVIPRTKGIADFYPAEMGNLRFKSRNIYFQKVFNDAKAEQDFVLYNQGEKAINLNLDKSFKDLGYFLQVTSNKTNIAPKDSAILHFTYDAAKRNDWDYVSDMFTLYTDDTQQPEKSLYVSATIVENFGNITSTTPLPIIQFDKTKHNFGQINQNTRNTVSFTLKNAGNAPLIIHKTKASCGCTASQPKKTHLAPGESTTIEVTYSPGNKEGQQRQTVTVICNDPATSTSRLTVEAEVISAPNQTGNNSGNK
ncbi:MAG: DUF1573 domain-containing protein [Microscillaceae bacterium]|nr:DUF1573 domain-containing protein [Microscillaceae bacterium]